MKITDYSILLHQVTVDLHCGQIQGFFHDTPVDNLSAENEFCQYLETKEFDKNNVCILFPLIAEYWIHQIFTKFCYAFSWSLYHLTLVV
jgi:hypothetical protein